MLKASAKVLIFLKKSFFLRKKEGNSLIFCFLCILTSLNPSKGGKPRYILPPLEGLREVKLILKTINKVRNNNNLNNNN